MRRLESNIDVNSETYRRFYAHNKAMVADFRAKQDAARFQRPDRDMQRLARQEKLFVRDRIDLLLDPGTPFLEIQSLAANMEYDGEVPSGGNVSGIGIVGGREVCIHADDSSVKGGAWYPHSMRKIIRILDIAIENRLPVVHLCDSAGGYLPLQAEVFPDRYVGGRIFRNQSILSKLNCPQVAIVLGHCTAGGAYIPGLSDYSIIKRGTGAIFLGGPPLVKAATGEINTADEIGGCDLHTRVSGTADYPAATEEEAIAIAREIVATFKRPQKTPIEMADPEPPYYDPNELYGIIPDDNKIQLDVREIIARIVDGSRFHEYQPAYGTTLVCGFARLWGHKIGILGNNGVLFNDSALKGAHFIELCNQGDVPMLFLQNITGYMVGRDYEAAGITKDGAKMIMAQACSKVPKFTVITGNSFGAGNYGMCGRAFDGRFLFTWPNSKIGVMGGEQAANVLNDLKVAQLKREGRAPSDGEIAAIREPILESYERECSAYYATSKMWDDGIIDPVDTRNALGIAISTALNAPFGDPGYGVFRM